MDPPPQRPHPNTSAVKARPMPLNSEALGARLRPAWLKSRGGPAAAAREGFVHDISRCYARMKATEVTEPDSEARDLAIVLLVDDNEAALELARIMLSERSGLHCRFMS